MLKKLFRTINEIADPSLRFSHYLSVIKVCKIKPKVNEISKEFFVQAYQCSTIVIDPKEKFKMQFFLCIEADTGILETRRINPALQSMSDCISKLSNLNKIKSYREMALIYRKFNHTEIAIKYESLASVLEKE